MSGNFKDTREMVGDMRGGFKAGAPVAAAGSMIALSICYEIVFCFVRYWQFGVVFALGLSGFVFFTVASVHLKDWIDYVLYFSILIFAYVKFSAAIHYFASRYKKIEKDYGTEGDLIHKDLVISGVVHYIKLFIGTLIVFWFLFWISDHLTMFNKTWIRSDLARERMTYWLAAFCVYGPMISYALNFKDTALYFVKKTYQQVPNITDEQLENVLSDCEKDLTWTWRGALSVLRLHAILLVIVVGLLMLWDKLKIWGIIV